MRNASESSGRSSQPAGSQGWLRGLGETLLIVGVAELIVMLALDRTGWTDGGPVAEAVADVAALTLIAGPILWWRQLQRQRVPAPEQDPLGVAPVVAPPSRRRLWAAGAAFSIVMTATLGYLVIDQQRQTRAVRHRQSLIEANSRMLVLDERLTMLATLAARSGDEAIESRYDDAERELAAEIAASRDALARLVGERIDEALAALAGTDAANSELVALEREAFALVRAGHPAQAAALIDSHAYHAAKTAYADSSARARRHVDSMIAETLAATRTRLLSGVALGLAVSAIALATLLTSLSRGQMQLHAFALRADRLAQIARHNPRAVLILDRDGRIEWVNDSFVRITGHGSDEALGRLPSELLCGPRTDPASIDAFVASAAAGEDVTGEMVCLTRDGREYVAVMEVRPLRSEEGAISGQMAIVADVTEQRRAEAERLESEQKFRALVDNVPGVTYRCDPDEQWTMRFISHAVEELTGHPASDFVDNAVRSFASLIHPEDRVPVQLAIATALRRHETFSVEYRIVTASGAVRWVSDRGQAIFEGDRAIALDGVVLDVTSRKQAEQRLAESEERWNLALEGSGDGVWDWNVAENTAFYSPRWKRLLGYDDDEVGSSPDEWLTRLHPDDRDRVLAEIRAHLDGGSDVYVGEQRMRCKDGSYRSMLSRGKVIARDANGRGLRAVGIQTDLTELKLIEAELAQTRKLESIGALAAGIAHEINTPVQFVNDNVYFLRRSFDDVVALVAQLLDRLRDGGDDAKAVDALLEEADYEFLRDEIPRALRQSGEGLSRISRIVSAMKDFSHPSEGQKTEVDLNEAIQTTLVVCHNRWKYCADVETDLDPLLPRVSCVRDEIHQVVLNLVVNAADAIGERQAGDASRRGRIRISTRPGDGHVEIRVEDDGAGIPAQVRERIFDPFFTTKEVGKGTGQGLTICRSVIVNRHGGSIRCESEPGVGTAFIVQIPHAPSGRA